MFGFFVYAIFLNAYPLRVRRLVSAWHFTAYIFMREQSNDYVVEKQQHK